MPISGQGYFGQQGMNAKSAGWIEPQATHLGGFNNPLQDPGLIEGMQDQRLGQLGAAQDVHDLPDWEKNQQSQYQDWANASQKLQQDQYNQAMAQFNGGPTAAQDALMQQQGAQQGALQSMAHSAGGGARGAAAAGSNAVSALGMNQGMQANQMVQQKLADKYAAADLMSGIANQQRGVQQGEWNQQAMGNADLAGYQQGWNSLNDQAALWADTMHSQRTIGDLGGQTQAAGLNNQNALFNQQMGMGYFGAGVQALGGQMNSMGQAYGSGNQGGGNSGNSGDSPYGLGNNAENPWWNG